MKLIHDLKVLICFLFFFLLTGKGYLLAQKPAITPPGDSLKDVQILNATRQLTFKTINDTTKLTIIAGNVKLRQGNTLFYCDSCVINNNTNIFESWGHVHINDSDTTDIYSNHLRYLMKTKDAFFDGGVKLTDGKAILTTPDLEYNMQTNLGIYKNGGKLINKNTVLTSQEGWYFSDLKDAYFKKNVVLKDPAYTITTDSLLHNAETQITRFISYTVITDSSGRIIKTRDGFINQKTGVSEFGQHPEIIDGDTRVTGRSIKNNDSTGLTIVEGNAVVIDNKNHNTIIAGIIYRNKKTDAFLAARKPLMIIKQENDSIYITADTLFSARLTDLHRPGKLTETVHAAKDSNVVIDSSGKKIKVSLKADSITMTRDSVSARIKDTVLARAKDTTSIKIKDTVPSKTKDTLITKIRDTVSARIQDTTIARAKDTVPARIKDTVSAKGKDTVLVRRNVEAGKRKDLISRKGVESDTSVVKPDATVITQQSRDDLERSIDSLLLETTKKPGDSIKMVSVRTLKGTKMVAINDKDSANRYFEAYHHVRIFNDSLQATCDSLFYSFKDSLFRLFQDPVVWAKESQITGDTILLFTKNKKADRLQAFENGFMVNKLDSQAFNQVKATRIDGYFTDGNMDSVRAKGSSECIYYIQDEDSAYTGINESKCDILDAYFRNKELSKVVFRSAVTGTLWPIRQKSPSEMRLSRFRWLEERRPKTKFEMFE
ncbi:MAG: OstA-like protein [Bacteroidota bacterium]|nr:OstA-like protein [Bacteroidota bacterium]